MSRPTADEIISVLSTQQISQRLASVSSGSLIAKLELIMNPLEPTTAHYVVSGPANVHSRNRVRNVLPGVRSVPSDDQLRNAQLANVDIAYYIGRDPQKAIEAYVEVAHG